MLSNRIRGLMCAASVAWVGIGMPFKVMALLWQLRRMPSVWEEIIPLCFLIALSVRLVVETLRRSV
jgi:hypothetical protein